MEIIADKNENLVKNLKKHKILAEKINLKAKFKKHQPKKADLCAECGNFLNFEVYKNQHTNETKRVLKNSNFCKVKWCPMCAWRKCRKLADEFKSIFSQIEETCKVRYLFLTLSVKNPVLQDLKEAIKQMSKAFRLMTIKDENFKKSVLGYLRCIEFIGDETKEGQAHPHFHCILAVPNYYFLSNYYITQTQWLQMWQKALKVDYKPTANIKPIKSKNDRWKDSDSAIYETLKYVAKPTKIQKMNAEVFNLLDSQTKYVRQYNKGGIFKEFKPQKNQKLDPEIWHLMEIEFYKWQNGDYVKQNL